MDYCKKENNFRINETEFLSGKFVSPIECISNRETIEKVIKKKN